MTRVARQYLPSFRGIITRAEQRPHNSASTTKIYATDSSTRSRLQLCQRTEARLGHLPRKGRSKSKLLVDLCFPLDQGSNEIPFESGDMLEGKGNRKQVRSVSGDLVSPQRSPSLSRRPDRGGRRCCFTQSMGYALHTIHGLCPSHDLGTSLGHV
jgi:hypothetical protein